MNSEIQSLLDDFLPRLEKLKTDALAEIEVAQQEATANVSRHDQVQEELVQVEATIARYEQEQERLPNLAYRAGLDEDWPLEDELKERYRSLKPALEALEEQRNSLRQELRSLNPVGDDHPSNAAIAQYGTVARTAYGPRAELEALKKRLIEALDGSVNPVVQKHESLKATVEALSRDRAWATSPVGQGGVR